MCVSIYVQTHKNQIKDCGKCLFRIDVIVMTVVCMRAYWRNLFTESVIGAQ